ncbi:MAG: 3-isopropylmalate dehydrogenase [Desulfovibrio sp.]|jgi:3-isopropylmalate dehydrogenase|nr:3-isopropylmalate dehydrogenase [Desulfovibrio sp.]
MEKKIVVLPGDGIGPEVTAEAIKVLRAVEKSFGCVFALQEALIGGAAYEAAGDPLPPETLAACRSADAVLMGAVGDPRQAAAPVDKRPEAGLLRIRKELGLYANLRPATVFPDLISLSCLRPERLGNGLDLLVVRELTGGLYFGEPAGEDRRDGVRRAFNTMLYTEEEIRRIARVGFAAARKRKARLCSVDKANVLAVSRLWREVVEETRGEFPDVELSHMYVDNCAMQLVLRPEQFDVLLTENLFGDILSDETAAIAGSLGLLPSASLSGPQGGAGLYEPVHGSAPDIAGQDRANPLASILSLAMMLDMSCGLPEAAAAVETAVRRTLREGYRTEDIAAGLPGTRLVGCREMGDLVAGRIARAASETSR